MPSSRHHPMIPQPANPIFDVLTIGDMCVDFIISGKDVIPEFNRVAKLVDDYTLEMGGSCCIFACQAARLGLRTAVLGKVGDDSFGRLILQRLNEAGVDTRYVSVEPALKTGIGVAFCPPGDRAILTYMGTINAVEPVDVTSAILASARHLHHGSYYLQSGIRTGIPLIFEQAQQLGMTTSLDTNWDPEECWDGGLDKILPHTSVFMPNEQEAIHISRKLSPLEFEIEDCAAAAKQFLQAGVQVVTIKAGASGAAVYTRDGQISADATPVSGGDSIGAGDSFDAGFLSGWLRGYSLQESLEFAMACGRRVAGEIGGLAGQPTWEEISQHIKPR